MRRALLVLTTGILVLSGCGSTHRAAAPVSPTSTTATTQGVDQTRPTSPTASTTTSSVKPALAGSLTCTTTVLAITAGRVGVGLGHVGVPLVFRNTGTGTCRLRGYPGVAALDATGRQVVEAQRTPNGYLGGVKQSNAAPPVVDLAAGQIASALVEGSDVPTGNASACPSFAALLVTPPGETVSTQVAVKVPGCSTLQVHPIVAGDTGSSAG